MATERGKGRRYTRSRTMAQARLDLHGHVALITGANHGIGAATARALGSYGAAVVVTYLRIPDAEQAGPEPYRHNRAMNGDHVVEAIGAEGGRAIALEADLSESDAPIRLFDAAEGAFGAVDILINNASGWCADTFAPVSESRFGHQHRRVSAATFDPQAPLARDAVAMVRGSALHVRETTNARLSARSTIGPVGCILNVYPWRDDANENPTMGQ